MGPGGADGRRQVAGGRWKVARRPSCEAGLSSLVSLAAVLAAVLAAGCRAGCWLLAAGRWLYLWALNPPADGSKRAACEGDTPAATLRSRRWLEVEDRMRPPPKATKAPGTFHFSVNLCDNGTLPPCLQSRRPHVVGSPRIHAQEGRPIRPIILSVSRNHGPLRLLESRRMRSSPRPRAPSTANHF
jgi:hypothetical protein